MHIIQIAIIEDDEVIRESFAFLIEQNSRHKVIQRFSSCEAALESRSLPDVEVILLDIALPGMNGIDAIRILRKAAPLCAVLMLTVSDQEESVFKALKNGASGYLTKNTPVSKIIAAIEEVVEGGGPMSSAIARLVINSFQRAFETPLTKRETEILEKIAMGKSRKQISSELFIEVETIKTHIKNIYFKLNVHSKEEAIHFARSNRLI